MPHVDRSIIEPRSFIENNVQLILTLLEYVRDHPVEKFLHISTDEVFGPAAVGHEHAEWETHRPSNPYAASKAMQTEACYAYWRTYGLPIGVTQTMNIIGERQDPEKFVPLVLAKVLAGGTVSIHARQAKVSLDRASTFTRATRRTRCCSCFEASRSWSTAKARWAAGTSSASARLTTWSWAG